MGSRALSLALSSSLKHLVSSVTAAAPLLADYINFMKQVTPETTQEYMTQLKRFNMGAPGESDCPVFDGMYEYFAVRTHHIQHSACARCTQQQPCCHPAGSTASS